MLKKYNFSDFITQVMNAIEVMKDTIPFIRKNKLWMGFFEHKWITFFSAIISLLFSWFVLDDLGQLFSSGGGDQIMQLGLTEDWGEISDTVKKEGRDALFSGGTKYLFIILLEVIIFYFSMKTLSILTNNINIPSFSDFVNAEKRMIKLMIRSFVKGLIAQVIVYIGLFLIGFSSMTSFVMFFVYSYFIGYAFLDNYNEQFDRNIKDSEIIIQQHAGAATAFGIAVSGFLYVPLIGPLLTPILGGVAAAIYGQRYGIEKEINFE